MLDGNWYIRNVLCFLLCGWGLSTAPVRAQCEVAKLTAGDPEPQSYFGRAVAVSTEHVLVGRTSGDGLVVDSGTAYVFKREGESWVEQAMLMAADGDYGDHFGGSVGLHGEFAIVGAFGDDDRANAAGAAYVYRLEGATWVEEAKLLANDGADSDYLGRAVAIDEGFVVAGAPTDDEAALDSGSVYVFVRQGSDWTQLQELTASDASSYAEFGSAVAIFGDHLIVGAYQASPHGVNGGAAYVFKRQRGAWVEQAKLTPSDASQHKRFGEAVAISEDFALVGAIYDDHGGWGTGAAYLFRREGSTWIEVAKLIASDFDTGDYFGQAVAIDGMAAIVGAPRKDHPLLRSAGAVYVFMQDGGDWVQRTRIQPTDKEAGDYFGEVVSVEDGVAIVGAPHKSGVGWRSGAAYIYEVYPGPDCNSNGMNDACEQDCNRNGIPDDCDIDQATSQDLNANGIPDECELSVLHVDADATGANNGASWTDAYTDLQDAIENVLVPGWDVSEIWVAEGTYRPAPPGGLRTATFHLIDGVAMYGGFAGWETQRTERRPAVHVTILSGDLNGDDGPGFANRGDNVYHVLIGLDHGAPPVLDGFTITAGNAVEPSPQHRGGGGLRCTGSPIVVHCLFTGNRARRGAGMYSFGSPTLYECTFADNFATHAGGGMALLGTRPTLIGCTFARNSTDGSGGGLSLYASDRATLTNCVFEENHARRGGGVFDAEYHAAVSVIEGCEFHGNTAISDGGGLYYRREGTLTLSDCVFTGNSAGRGAGIFNSSYLEYRGLRVGTCTFTGNLAFVLGGGIYHDGSYRSPVINCILWGNRDERGMGKDSQYAPWAGVQGLEYSCIQGLRPHHYDSNIGNDPMFVDPGYWDENGTPGAPLDDVWVDGDYHLLLGSPCIDAGDPDSVPEPGAVDFDGEPRVFNDRVDMGADEYHDCNGDGVADYEEIADGSGLDCDEDHVLDECEAGEVVCGGLDVKPGACPNPVNRSSHGYLPVAVVGTGWFDVTEIDVGSVRLSRADGVGGAVAPNEGPPGPHSAIDDVATPFGNPGCACHELEGDGIDDLVMKFRTEEVVTGLELGSFVVGDEIELVVTGVLVDGTEFVTVGDCIVIVGSAL